MARPRRFLTVALLERGTEAVLEELDATRKPMVVTQHGPFMAVPEPVLSRGAADLAQARSTTLRWLLAEQGTQPTSV